MVSADNGHQRWTIGPRSVVLHDQNAGNLIDFSAEALRDGGGPGARTGARRYSNWSDDGQNPSARETTQLACAPCLSVSYRGREWQ
jgi:hypothetical protein